MEDCFLQNFLCVFKFSCARVKTATEHHQVLDEADKLSNQDIVMGKRPKKKNREKHLQDDALFSSLESSKNERLWHQHIPREGYNLSFIFLTCIIQ